MSLSFSFEARVIVRSEEDELNEARRCSSEDRYQLFQNFESGVFYFLDRGSRV